MRACGSRQTLTQRGSRREEALHSVTGRATTRPARAFVQGPVVRPGTSPQPASRARSLMSISSSTPSCIMSAVTQCHRSRRSDPQVKKKEKLDFLKRRIWCPSCGMDLPPSAPFLLSQINRAMP